MKAAIVISVFLLAGCASLKDKLEQFASRNSPSVSYVQSGIGGMDAAAVANDMAQFLQHQMPAAKTTIVLEPLRNPLHDELVEQLTSRGFGIMQRKPDPEQAVTQLRYMVTTLDSGILVRMSYQGQVASRFYSRAADGRLSLENRYAIRGAAE
jgi:hypothetical protein